MSEGPEKAFRKKICTELVKHNAKIINNIQYGGQVRRGQFLTPGEPGISDVTMIHKDTGIIFLEFKSSEGKLSPLQKRFLQEVNERVPYSGFVVRENKYEKYIGDLEYIFPDGSLQMMFWRFEDAAELINHIKIAAQIRV